ncbi:MAG: T9SS type A sorting domain-containing protein [Bacteroidia bacterium]
MKTHLTLFFLILLNQKPQAQNMVVNGVESLTPIPYKIQNNTVACDTIFSFPAVDPWPAGITYDGSYLWNTGGGSYFIYKYDLNGQLIASIPSPGMSAGGDLDFDGANLLVCVEQDGILYKVNPLTGAVISQFNLPNNNIGNPTDPNNYGVAFDGAHIWSTEYSTPTSSNSRLFKHNALTGAVIDSFILADKVLPIKFINGGLYGIAISPPLLHKIDTATGNYLSSVPWCIPFPLGLILANYHIWATSSNLSFGGTQRIYEFDSLLLDVHELSNPLNNQLQIYPNPANDEITISSRGLGIQFSKIEIFNCLGEIVLSHQPQTLNFKLQTLNFPHGLYIIKAYTDKEVFQQKIMISH